MKTRWDSITEDINFFISIARNSVNFVLSSFKQEKGRGRNPKHSLADYVTLLVLKEYDKKSLRSAEGRLSNFVCKERVDHSVIAYWEQKHDVQIMLEKIIKHLGQRLMKYIPHDFSMIDATKFSDWRKDETNFHLFNRISPKSVYPTGISFLTGSLASPVGEAIDQGGGKLYADAGYDDNKSIGIIFGKGYEPVVCPNKSRWKGYFRKKARKIYNKFTNRLGYRQRGRGESCFGSLTNKFGDRLTTRNEQTIRTRIASRVISYQIRLLMRTIRRLFHLIFRHAHKIARFIYCFYFK